MMFYLHFLLLHITIKNKFFKSFAVKNLNIVIFFYNISENALKYIIQEDYILLRNIKRFPNFYFKNNFLGLQLKYE